MFKSRKLDSKAFVYGEINGNEKSTSNGSKGKFKILTSLLSTNTIQKNFCFKVRLVRMINIKTKE